MLTYLSYTEKYNYSWSLIGESYSSAAILAFQAHKDQARI